MSGRTAPSTCSARMRAVFLRLVDHGAIARDAGPVAVAGGELTSAARRRSGASTRQRSTNPRSLAAGGVDGGAIRRERDRPGDVERRRRGRWRAPHGMAGRSPAGGPGEHARNLVGRRPRRPRRRGPMVTGRAPQLLAVERGSATAPGPRARRRRRPATRRRGWRLSWRRLLAAQGHAGGRRRSRERRPPARAAACRRRPRASASAPRRRRPRRRRGDRRSTSGGGSGPRPGSPPRPRHRQSGATRKRAPFRVRDQPATGRDGHGRIAVADDAVLVRRRHPVERLLGRRWRRRATGPRAQPGRRASRRQHRQQEQHACGHGANCSVGRR